MSRTTDGGFGEEEGAAVPSSGGSVLPTMGVGAKVGVCVHADVW